MKQRQLEEPDAIVDADLAAVYFGLGDLDKSFAHLDICLDNKMAVNYFLEFPNFRESKKDPRYNALLKRMGVDNFRQPASINH